MNYEKVKEHAETIVYAELRGVGHTTLHGVDGEKKEHDLSSTHFTVAWGAKDIGFGEFTMMFDGDGSVKMDTETMSKEFCLAVLVHAMEKAKLEP